MKPENALEEFKKLVSEKTTGVITPAQGIDLMIEFYETTRADHCDIDCDGDMLLFEWGIYDWGNGEFFEYSITRQFIFPITCVDDEDEWEDDAIYQLKLNFLFEPTEILRKVESGSVWCERPAQIADFKVEIKENKASEIANSIKPAKVEISFENKE